MNLQAISDPDQLSNKKQRHPLQDQICQILQQPHVKPLGPAEFVIATQGSEADAYLVMGYKDWLSSHKVHSYSQGMSH